MSGHIRGTDHSRDDLDASRLSQVSYGSRSSGIVHLGGADYPIGSTVGSSGLFVIGDPATKANRGTDSVRTSQSNLSQYSSVVGGELVPTKGHDFEYWNWPVIRCSCLVLLLAIVIALVTATIATVIQAQTACDSQYLWWQGKVLYHLRVSEFHDSDGNFVGDVRGLERKIDYLQYLGVEGVIITNFLPSTTPFWEKVTSFTSIDQRAGTMEDFISLVNSLHKKELSIILEINAAYTSDQHEWFIKSQEQNSVSNNIYTHAYNWENLPKSTEDGYWYKQSVRNQYYQYDKVSNDTSKPTLNWEHIRVQVLIEEVMEFWLKLGVDGFYMKNVRHFKSFEKMPERMVTVIGGWSRTLQKYENYNREKVLMIDWEDVEMLERVEPTFVGEILTEVNLLNVPIAVDPKNVTGSLFGQAQKALSRYNIGDRDLQPWLSFNLVNVSDIKDQHLSLVEFYLAYLPGTPIFRAGLEIGRDPDDRLAGLRTEPFKWGGDSENSKPYHSGSTLDLTFLDRLVLLIKSRSRYPSLRGMAYEVEGVTYKGYDFLHLDKNVIFIRRSQYQKDSIFFAANFFDISVPKDLSQYTTFGVYISDSSSSFPGGEKFKLKDLNLPKETALVFKDII